MPLDRVDDLAMLAVLALHRHSNDAMERGDEEKHGKKPSKDEAEHDQQHAEYRRERLAVEQKSERRQKKCQEI